MSTPEKQDPLILRCLKAAAGIDWKALALVLAALGGLGGAIWNRVDSWVEKALAARTQQGVYEVLAQRMDEISARLEALEATHTIKGVAPTHTSTKAEPTVTQVATTVPVKATPVLNALEKRVLLLAPEAMQFKRARLPSFQILQQRAVDDVAPVLQAAPASE